MKDRPDCQARYTVTRDAQGRAIMHTPVGQVKIHIPQPGALPQFVTIARSYADMHIAVESMEAGTVFMVALETNLHRTGDGRYRPVSAKLTKRVG